MPWIQPTSGTPGTRHLGTWLTLRPQKSYSRTIRCSLSIGFVEIRAQPLPPFNRRSLVLTCVLRVEDSELGFKGKKLEQRAWRGVVGRNKASETCLNYKFSAGQSMGRKFPASACLKICARTVDSIIVVNLILRLFTILNSTITEARKSGRHFSSSSQFFAKCEEGKPWRSDSRSHPPARFWR